MVGEKGGYDVDFVDSEPQNVNCSICLFVLREPMQAEQCGHRYCKSCFEDLKQSSTLPLLCPEDRIEINVFQDRGKEREISKYRVTCVNKKDGCDWVDELLHLKNHLTTCLHQLISCENSDCEVTLPRWDMTSHLKNSCRYRSIVCKHCGKLYLFVEEEMHIEVCEGVLVQCQLCKTNLPRLQLEEHMSDLCPKKLHDCGYADVGCTEKVLLEDLSFHELNTVQHHLSLAMNKIREQGNKIDGLTSKLSALSNFVHTSKAITAFKDEEIIEFRPFKQYFADAKAGKDGFINNFFALDGYHCQVRVLLNGNSQTQHQHMSIDITIPHGPFDGSIEWPMKAAISFGLLKNGNQKKNVYTFSTRSSSVNQVFNKAGVNASAGISYFLPHHCFQDYTTGNILKIFVNIQPLVKNLQSHKVEYFSGPQD